MSGDSARPAPDRWYPVAGPHDTPRRHVHEARLLGHELAVWRADDGNVNVWVNRCLHRGVRLTVGTNDGAELVCRYHGWRYANRTAECTYIPAHPADAPARTICNRSFPTVERYGLVWANLAGDGELDPVAPLEDAEVTVLRPLPVRAPAEMVRAALADPTVLGSDGSAARVVREHVEATWSTDDGDATVVWFVQPTSDAEVVVRGVLDRNLADPTAARRALDLRLTAWRDRIEPRAAERAVPPGVPVTLPTSAPVDEVAVSSPGPAAPLRVRVARAWAAADEVRALRLESIDGPLPAPQPGAHIDVHLPNGLVRQYSLIDGPGGSDHYTIGVKREPNSRGGSQAVHDTVREGDVLAVSEPHHTFHLRRDAEHTVLVAGGIGLTPLLAMARTLDHASAPFALHLFTRGAEHRPFSEILDALGATTSQVVDHFGLDPAATVAALAELIGPPTDAHQIYVCGPPPLIAAVRERAADQGWPDERVHFEYFTNDTEIDDSSSFAVSLARSAVDFTVPAGRTILEVAAEHGVAVPSSCRQGACGTCATVVLDGEPLHQDVHLSESEKAAGDRMMICVSRAAGDRLVLDL